MHQYTARSLRNHAVPRVGNYAAVLSLLSVSVFLAPCSLLPAPAAHRTCCSALRPSPSGHGPTRALSRSVVLLCACSHSGVCWSEVSWWACVWGVFIVSECVVLSLSLVGVRVGGGVASELDVGTTTHA